MPPAQAFSGQFKKEPHLLAPTLEYFGIISDNETIGWIEISSSKNLKRIAQSKFPIIETPVLMVLFGTIATGHRQKDRLFRDSIRGRIILNVIRAFLEIKFNRA